MNEKVIIYTSVVNFKISYKGEEKTLNLVDYISEQVKKGLEDFFFSECSFRSFVPISCDCVAIHARSHSREDLPGTILLPWLVVYRLSRPT